MHGPMIAQILGTFGLALFLRYAVFWYFGGNFLSLPDEIVGPPLRPRRASASPRRGCSPAPSARR